MALRRAPTRIELKPDDIEQYDEIIRERQEEAARSAPNFSVGGKSSRGGNSSSNNNSKFDPPSNAKRKVNVAERIGISGGIHPSGSAGRGGSNAW